MSAAPGAGAPGGDPASAPVKPAEVEPINAIALAKEVVLDRVERLLTWLLERVQRYRAKRGDWWER